MHILIAAILNLFHNNQILPTIIHACTNQESDFHTLFLEIELEDITQSLIVYFVLYLGFVYTFSNILHSLLHKQNIGYYCCFS